MKMLVRAALLLSAVPAHAAIVPSPAATGDPGVFQVGAMKVPATVRVDSSGNEVSGGDASAANQAATQAPVTPATATATKSQLLGGEYRSTLPTWTNTQQGAIQLGTRGSINVQLKVADGTGSISSTATGADDTTNGYTALRTEAYGMVFDGTTWDRQRGTSADGTLVYGTTLAQDASVDGLEAALVSANASLDDIEAAVEDVTTPSPVNSNIGQNAPVRIVSAAGVTEDETQVCAAACTVLRVSGYNAAAAVRYIKFTNLTAANTTPGTSAVYWSIPIPATSPFSIPIEQYFSTAATVYLVTGAADNDVAEVTAADIVGLAITTK